MVGVLGRLEESAEAEESGEIK
jgi:hypothetical protein